jgi:site-specific recombinase XerC
MTQELMGHASPAATAIYTAWAQDKAAIVIDRLYGATSPDL